MAWHLALTGLLVGWLVGATGMGGGSLMTPILVLLFGFQPALAVGTDILHGAIFKTFGALRHRRLGTVHARLSGWMLVGSAPASLGGVALATWLRHRYGDSGNVSEQILGVALVLGGLGLLAKALVRANESAPESFWLTPRDRVAALSIGLVGGFVVGLTSIGTGVFFGLTLLIAFPLRSSKVVGTDIFHAAALLWVAGAGHLVAGNVALGTVGWLLVGSIPGVLLGAQLSVSIPDRTLRMILGTTLILSGFVMSGPRVAGMAAAATILGGLVWIATPAFRRSSPHARRGSGERAPADVALSRASLPRAPASRSAVEAQAGERLG